MSALRKQLRRALPFGQTPVETPYEARPLLASQDEDQLPTIDTVFDTQNRTLTGNQAAFKKSRRKDRRWWVRLPAGLWHLLRRVFGQSDRNNLFRPAPWLGMHLIVYYPRRIFLRLHDGHLAPLLQHHLNILVLFVPVSIVSHGLDWASELVFSFSTLAIIGLSGLINTASEDLFSKFGRLARPFVSICDNIVELTVGIKRYTPIFIRLARYRLQ